MESDASIPSKFLLNKANTEWFVRFDPFNGWQYVSREYATVFSHREYADQAVAFLSKVDGMCYDKIEVIEEKEKTVVVKEYKYAVKEAGHIHVDKFTDNFYYLGTNNLLSNDINDIMLFSSKEEAKEALKLFRNKYGYKNVKFVYVKVPVK